MTADKRDSALGATRPASDTSGSKSGYVSSKSPSSPDATCEAGVAVSAEAVQRSDEAGYTVIDLDGNPWTICPWRYEAGR